MTKPLATALSEVRNRDRRIAKLEKQFSALQAENAKLRECVALYANESSWYDPSRTSHNDTWAHNRHGYEPAQKYLEKLRGGDV